MVITIPSKNIYSIDNQKIIDNQIDIIEGQANNVVLDNIYFAPVYNEIIYYGTGTESNKNTLGIERDNSVDFERIDNKWWKIVFAAGLKICDKYFTFNIKIPKKLPNKYITKIYQGKNLETNNPFIGLSKSFIETVYYEQVPSIFTTQDGINDYNNNGGGTFDFNRIINHIYTNIIQQQSIGDLVRRAIYNYPKPYESIMQDGDLQEGILSYWSEPEISSDKDLADAEEAKCQIYVNGSDATAHLLKTETTVDESDLSEIRYKEEDDKYVFYDVKLLFLREIYAPSSAVFLQQTNEDGVHFPYGRTYPAKVVKCEQKVVKADITIYGNAISIDFQDKTITIGNGKNVFEISGNELIQSTNTPTVESTCQKIIDDWKDGKEIATIRCAVKAYSYNNDKPCEVVIYQKDGESRYRMRIYQATELGYNDSIFYENEEAKILTALQDVGNGIWVCAIQVKENGKIANMLNKGHFYVNMFTPPIPKNIFEIGDIVQPCVYGANGKDKPMSSYKDLTPKNFEVLQTKFIYDGMPVQEIGIQEIKK